jgi:hypothetical protein
MECVMMIEYISIGTILPFMVRISTPLKEKCWPLTTITCQAMLAMTCTILLELITPTNLQMRDSLHLLEAASDYTIQTYLFVLESILLSPLSSNMHLTHATRDFLPIGNTSIFEIFQTQQPLPSVDLQAHIYLA